MIQPDKTLLQYLKLDPTHVINLTFDDYYFYPDTLINTKTKQIIRNLKLSPLLPLSRQIKHPITINKNLASAPTEQQFQTVLTIKIEDLIIYQEWITPVYNDDLKTLRIPRAYDVNAIITHPLYDNNYMLDTLSPNNYNIINI